MNKLAIIIPVKPPREGKSRLAAVLQDAGRYDLNLRLLRHTFAQAAGLHDIADVHVVSRSPDVIAEAAERGFETCVEPAGFELNDAVALAAGRAAAAGATEAMILPVDLPWLSSDRLRAIVDEFRGGGDVLIITDRAGGGTNVLLWRPLVTASFCYGIGSAKGHADRAAGLGLRVATRQDRDLSFDIDTPHDLGEWSSQGVA